MAIRLTDTIHTSEGSTITLYLRVTNFIRNKTGSEGMFPVEYFTNEDLSTPCKVFIDSLLDMFVFDISTEVSAVTATPATTDKIEKMAYEKIGGFLLAEGLNPESDETGAWVAYT